MIRINSNQYQDLSLMLEKALAKKKGTTSDGSSSDSDKVVSKTLKNTVIEKQGNTITIYKLDENNKKTKMQEIDATTEQGLKLSQALDLDEDSSSQEDTWARLQTAQASMSLVNYLA